MKKYLILSAAIFCLSSVVAAPASSHELSQDILDEAWTQEQTAEVLDKTMRIQFDFNESAISENETRAVKELLRAGDRLHALYLEQRHPEARAAKAALDKVEGREDLGEIFRIMKGPIATTLDNNREAFLNVSPETPPRNVYPAGTEKAEFDAFLDAHPEKRAEMMHLRSVVRKTTSGNKLTALKALDTHPALDVLHPGLRARIKDAEDYFALPYSVVYADDIMFVYDRLIAAAGYVETEDIAFARFLRLRARDLLADDYDGGDAAWVTGKFTGNLNAQIGSYETYDDALYGVKSFFSLSLLQRDIPKSDELAAAIGDIQAIEDALPYTANKKVRSDIPVGVYNVIADYGQARGTNTATILPNEGHLSRQYGRTILIRSNVLRNQKIFDESHTAFKAAVDSRHHADHELEGNFYRTLWHEIGHYMGPDQTRLGEDIDAALQDTADMMEEMKADLVSLFSASKLHQTEAYTDEQFRAVYAGGIMRVLQKNKPRRDQAYGTMKLIQYNWFTDKGLIALEDGKLVIDYDRYPAAVESLLKEVLNIQYQGDLKAANAFIDQWTSWDENNHGAVANAMKAAEGSRYRLVTYEALGETP